MKQYCRYCANAIESSDCENVVWCEKHHKEMTHTKAKRPNRCKDFILNEIDIFNGGIKRYKPREKKIKIKIEQKELF